MKLNSPGTLVSSGEVKGLKDFTTKDFRMDHLKYGNKEITVKFYTCTHSSSSKGTVAGSSIFFVILTN